MAPVPGECHDEETAVTDLEKAYNTLATQVPALTGEPAWKALAQLGSLRSQLADAQGVLDECVKKNTATVGGTVLVIDASGAPPAALAQTATLWDVTSGASFVESTPVQSGTFGFRAQPPSAAAITIDTTGAPDVTGPDFRSGKLLGPLSGQKQRLEMVIGPVLTLSAAALRSGASAFQATSQDATVGGIPVHVTVDTLAVELGNGFLTFMATGTITGTIASVTLTGRPYTASAALSAIPSHAPEADTPVDLTLAGPNPIQLSIPGSDAFAYVANAIGPFVGDIARAAGVAWLKSSVQSAVATGLALALLPPDVTISLRALDVSQQRINFQPALGAVGTTLSTFHTSPLPVSPPPV